MKKLNNKGITTIEVILCFVLVVMITVSMYSTISYFNEKRIIENYKEQVYSYKDLLTKEIQDDFIKIGLTHAEYKQSENGDETIHTLTCTLKDGTKRELVVKQVIARSSYHLGGKEGIDDSFMIQYGKPGELINHPLPDLGYSGFDSVENKSCNPDGNAHCNKILDFSINNVKIDIKDENVLIIYIGFYHPELSTRYGINIVAPIDYVSDTEPEETTWNY